MLSTSLWTIGSGENVRGHDIFDVYVFSFGLIYIQNRENIFFSYVLHLVGGILN